MKRILPILFAVLLSYSFLQADSSWILEAKKESKERKKTLQNLEERQEKAKKKTKDEEELTKSLKKLSSTLSSNK